MLVLTLFSAVSFHALIKKPPSITSWRDILMGAQVDAIGAMCAAQPPLRMVLSRDCDRGAASAAGPVAFLASSQRPNPYLSHINARH